MSKKLISRKKFLSLIFLSFVVVFFSDKNNLKYKISNSEKVKNDKFKDIEKFNRKRKKYLLEDYDKAYLSDLKNSRTIWVNKSLMTYAELWN